VNMYFQPTREDGRSYKEVAVDFLKTKLPEDTISYKELGVELWLNAKSDLTKIQAAARAANVVLLKKHSRAIRSVKGFGYRIIPAREHMAVARTQETRADKAMGRALAFYEGANLSEMTEIERRLHQGQHMLAQAVMASHKQINRRMDRIEDLLKGGTTVNP